jgi:tetratricopeptide (TPR) repeat protein
VAVVRQPAVSKARELALLRWGLIPAWADDPSVGDHLANARSETAATKPSFRRALRSRRCLVVADGFYEWRRADGRKQPYFVGLKNDRPFGLAGLWERWEKHGEPVESCTILTTGANELMRALTGIEEILKVIRPTRADVLLIRASDAYDDGFFKEAVRFLDALIQTTPNRAHPFHFRANVKERLHDVSGALKDYDEAIALDESNVDALLDRGEMFERMGFLDKALADYESAITKEPRNAEGYYNRGSVRTVLKDYEGALKDLGRSIELDSSDPAKYAKRGFLMLMLGRHHDANRDFGKANTLVEEQLSCEDDQDEDETE